MQTNKNLFYLAVCVFGIQFAVALQMANMSSFFKFLNVSDEALPYLWLAAPVTGLIVQPLVGQLSDFTVSKYGKRIPYIFAWGMLAAIALLLMPFAKHVYQMTLLLWILGSGINGSQEAVRALTADLSAEEANKTAAFALQTTFAGMGAVSASIMPWVGHKFFNLKVTPSDVIPLPFKIAFILGSIVLLVCLLLIITNVREKDVPRKSPSAIKLKITQRNFLQTIRIFIVALNKSIKNMPEIIKSFYLIQIFTWMGMFCFWLYLSSAIAQYFFGLPAHQTEVNKFVYVKIMSFSTEWTGVYQAIYQIVSIVYSLILPYLSKKLSYRLIHAISLIIGAGGIAAIAFVPNIYWVIPCMIGVGIMWGSIMTMPYVIMAAHLPRSKMGVYLGIFNITITLPQIISGLLLGPITARLFHSQTIYTLLLGATLLFIAGILLLLQTVTQIKLAEVNKLLEQRK